MTSRTAEIRLAELAGAQWGLVTTHQAQTAGISRTQLNRLAAADVLIRLTHGVYAMRTAAADDLLDLRYAWLTLDPARLAADRLTDSTPTAVVSHASAAHLHGHGDLLADRHEFTLPIRKQSRRPELRLHRSSLATDDVTIHRGLPVTTPARTVLDLLTTHHDGEHVAAVLADAVRARLVDVAALAPRLAPFAVRFGLPRGDGDATLDHLLELGDVTHEVEADAIAAGARGAGTTTNNYLAKMVSDAIAAQTTTQALHLERIHSVIQSALQEGGDQGVCRGKGAVLGVPLQLVVGPRGATELACKDRVRRGSRRAAGGGVRVVDRPGDPGGPDVAAAVDEQVDPGVDRGAARTGPPGQ